MKRAIYLMFLWIPFFYGCGILNQKPVLDCLIVYKEVKNRWIPVSYGYWNPALTHNKDSVLLEILQSQFHSCFKNKSLESLQELFGKGIQKNRNVVIFELADSDDFHRDSLLCLIFTFDNEERLESISSQKACFQSIDNY